LAPPLLPADLVTLNDAYASFNVTKTKTALGGFFRSRQAGWRSSLGLRDSTAKAVCRLIALSGRLRGLIVFTSRIASASAAAVLQDVPFRTARCRPLQQPSRLPLQRQDGKRRLNRAGVCFM